MTIAVKFFDSTMQGAPQLTNAWGSMTTLLDAVLVGGFATKVVDTITRVDAVATATVSAGHQYRVGQAILLAGADQAEYNGEFRLLSVTSTQFTFAVTGSPATPATGASKSAKVAPLNWDIAFTGTNKRAYRSRNLASNRPYLRVDDGLDPAYTTTYAKFAKVTMAEGMSDIDTFVGARAPYDPALPTKNEIGTGSGTSAINGWYKWYYAKAAGNTADSTSPATANRPWLIVGDDRGFYLFNEAVDSGGIGGKCFTDFDSYRSGDGFNTLLTAHNVYTTAAQNANLADGLSYSNSDWATRFTRTIDASGKVLMRSYLQVGGNVNPSFTSLNTNNGQTMSGYNTGIAWPNGPDYSLLLHPTLLMEGIGLRGKLPGMFWVHNDSPGFANMDMLTGVAGYPGRTFMLVKTTYGIANSYYPAFLAFDITGPWW